MVPFVKRNKLILSVSSVLLIVLIIVGVLSFQFFTMPQKTNNNYIANTESTPTPTTSLTPTTDQMVAEADANSLDPMSKGLALSGNNCTGEGSKKLGSAPMRTEQMSIIIPYGLMAAGHVTPIDHQYYWGKVQMGNPDMYDVLAPGDGKLIQLQYRDRSLDNGKVKGDYRGVIMYSCTFFSYFDLATSLSSDIQAQLPANWEKTNPYINTNVEVKQGQVIGKVGGQSLDFAIWDTTKTLKNLLVPTAYNNREPWKVNTVAPLDYFTDDVKAAILPFYANQSLKQDGTIDQDIDGKAAGNWFLEGTNGYAGLFDFSQQSATPYWDGHLSFAHDHLDPTGWVFSSGNVKGQAVQYAIKSPTVTPSELGLTSGLVKYQLAQWNHTDGSGQSWLAQAPVSSIKMVPGQNQGTVLVQMLADRRIKVEVFIGKTPTQVTGFTNAAKIYDRGDNAKMITSNTAN